MKTYMVAGGAGFLGSHLVKRLMGIDANVIVVDDLCTGSIDNIKQHFRSERFSFWNQSICTLNNNINIKLDGIFNFACPASPVHYMRMPIETNLTSTLGIYLLLQIAEDQKCKLLHTSTSEVYGDPQQHPQKEDYYGNVNSYGPRACYDEGKRAAEAFMYDYRLHHGVDTRIVRIFNTYGPNMAVDDGRVVSNFIVQALRGEDITMYGDGTQTRSFCYVDDMINAILSVWSCEEQTPINVGNPGEFTMLELAEKVLSLTESTSKIKFLPMPENDPKQRRPDISKMTQITGWRPHTSLDEGLVPTVEYFRNKLKGA